MGGGIVLMWLVFSVVVAAIGRSKGRSFIGFLLLSLILSPLVGLLAAMVMGRNARELEGRALWRGELKRCPECAETVQFAAQKCRHCGHIFAGDEGREDMGARAREVGAGVRAFMRAWQIPAAERKGEKTAS